MRRWRKVIGLKEPVVRLVTEQCVDREGELTTGDQD